MSSLILILSSVLDNILLVSIPVVELLMTKIYPLVCHDIVQLTLIQLSFKIYAITVNGRPLGTTKLHIPTNTTM